MDVAGPETLLLLFGCALGIGCIDAMSGGGGLLTVPLLLSLGFAPTHALATNKLQGAFGTGSSSFAFLQAGALDLRTMAPAAACAAGSAALGTIVVQHLDPRLLRAVIPFLLIGVALYFLFARRLNTPVDRPPLVRMPIFAPLIAGGIAFYDGLLGLGTGAFLVAATAGLLGQELRRATAHAKLLNFASNLGSLLFFVLGGQVVWAAGLAMAAGQIIGARIGAGAVLAKGARLVRPLVILAALAMAMRLFFTG
jgi:uncharacterized membrane protein YfcA